MQFAIIFTLASLATAIPTPKPTLPFGLIDLFPKYLANVGSCDLSKVTLPASTLPAPDAGLTLALVALGRGTQNYTCASSTSADKPVAAGALANLFNASCMAAYTSNNPNNLATYTQYKEQYPKDSAGQAPLPMVGEHYFVTSTTPSFFLSGLGVTEMKKNASAPAPNATADVAWLKLESQAAGTTSQIRNVFRVNTVSGVPPATCDGQQSAFTVQYAADYFFYTASS